MGNPPLRLLYLEDCDEDAELVKAVLEDRFGPCSILRAINRDAFEEGLRDATVDLILSDYALPSFDGLSALALAKALRPDLPFILISGTVNEALIAACLRQGAKGFARKHQLGLLPSLVREVMARTERAVEPKTSSAIKPC